MYQYAQAGYGQFVGFNIAWGYWLCTAFPNVAYGVMLNDSIGSFVPALLGHRWETMLFVSGMIWLMFFIAMRGVRVIKTLNNMLVVLKVAMITFLCIILAVGFDNDLFTLNFSDVTVDGAGLLRQSSDCMMVTLFCFIGIEGAAMMSARARRPSDVGRAGIAGFLISLLLYVAVTMLCFGAMSRAGLGTLGDPSVAYLLRETCGEWAYWCVIWAVIVALVGGWVSWTMIVAQVPYEASLVKMLPSMFSRVNSHGMPVTGLLVSSFVMEVFLVIILMADDVYLAALRITGMMVIPCYFFASVFMFRNALTVRDRVVAGVATLFCLWMVYAGGAADMMATSIFYIAGMPFYVKACREYNRPLLNRRSYPAAVILAAAAIATVVLMLF